MAVFEWNEAKRLSTLQKHGFDFFRAKRLFDGRPILVSIESLEDEIRFSSVGRLDGRLATAIWTVRGPKIRFISVRSAMLREGNFVSYTADEIEEKIARGEDQTDWARIDALTDEEIESSIDYVDEGRFDWEKAIPAAMMIAGSNDGGIRLDDDIFDWFKAHGGDTRAKINAVLRAYMDAHADEEVKPTRRKAS